MQTPEKKGIKTLRVLSPVITFILVLVVKVLLQKTSEIAADEEFNYLLGVTMFFMMAVIFYVSSIAVWINNQKLRYFTFLLGIVLCLIVLLKGIDLAKLVSPAVFLIITALFSIFLEDFLTSVIGFYITAVLLSIPFWGIIKVLEFNSTTNSQIYVFILLSLGFYYIFSKKTNQWVCRLFLFKRDREHNYKKTKDHLLFIGLITFIGFNYLSFQTDEPNTIGILNACFLTFSAIVTIDWKCSFEISNKIKQKLQKNK